jgi:hypothetical protein
MPVRLTSSLDVQGDSYLKTHHWELGANYRWLHSRGEDFFVGTARTPAPPAVQPPGGQPIEIDLHTVILGLTYAATDQIRLSISAPFQTGKISFAHEDGNRHSQTATGWGDVIVAGSAWLFNPRTFPSGNVSLGLGVKTPTGRNAITDIYYTAEGPERRWVDQAVQPGDGGWGIILELQAFQQISPVAVTYLSGFYLLNPQERTDVQIGTPVGLPGGGLSEGTPYFLSVPDAYSLRGGVSYAVLPRQGLSVSLGGRIDGVPVEDFMNGGDDNFRRPGYGAFVDPGLELTRGSNTFTLNIPVRVHGDRRANLYDRVVNVNGGGNLAKTFIFAGWTHRF